MIKQSYGNFKSTKEIAKAFGVTPTRVRQVALEHSVGSTKYGNRVFSLRDLRRLEKIFGRPAEFD